MWHSDETTVYIKKEGEKKHFEWIWNVMDAKTRYLLACRVTEYRYVEDTKKALHAAKVRANKRPDAVVTDSIRGYNIVLRSDFYDPSAFMANPHVRLKNFETRPNNNIPKRPNGTFRERTKVVRSLDADLTASEFADGMRLYYNYIRPHQGIGGLTQVQMANIPINLVGNWWETMIMLAVR